MLFCFRFQGGRGKAAQYRSSCSCCLERAWTVVEEAGVVAFCSSGLLSSGMCPSQLSLKPPEYRKTNSTTLVPWDYPGHNLGQGADCGKTNRYLRWKRQHMRGSCVEEIEKISSAYKVTSSTCNKLYYKYRFCITMDYDPILIMSRA